MRFVVKATAQNGTIAWATYRRDRLRLGPREDAASFFDRRQALIAISRMSAYRDAGFVLTAEPDECRPATE
jgi:hypothetical protein